MRGIGPVQRGAPAVAGCLPSLSLRSPQSSTPQPPSSCSGRDLPPHHASGPRSHRQGRGAPEACIGRVLWRVRSRSARTAAVRPWPQVEPFRRPTAIPLDPKSSSAASVLTDFARQSPSPKARPVAVLLPLAPVLGWSVRRVLAVVVRRCQCFGVTFIKAVRCNMSRAPVHPLPWP